MKRNPCKTCIWWLMKNNGWGHCHGRPPQLMVDKHNQVTARFPMTKGDSFCGDWEKRE